MTPLARSLFVDDLLVGRCSGLELVGRLRSARLLAELALVVVERSTPATSEDHAAAARLLERAARTARSARDDSRREKE